jgi:flagellar motor protein MotB
MNDDLFLQRSGARNTKDDEGNWIVAYADLITLLFILFVLLLSFSMVDQQKFSFVVDKINNKKTPTKILQTQFARNFNEPHIKVSNVQEGINISFGDILFSNGATKLSTHGKESLYKLYTLYRKHGAGKTMVVWGHTSTDEKKYLGNRDLWKIGFARSLAIINYLEHLGMRSELLQAKTSSKSLVSKIENSKVEVLLR